MQDASSKQQTKQKYKLNHQQTGWPPHSAFLLQSMGSRRVRHGWVTSLSLLHWRRKWQPTPVLLPGESHGRRSLVGYSAEFLFVCFSSDGQGWVRWWSCLLMIGFIFLFCLLFRWGILYTMLLVVGWCQVLYSSGFLCVSPHYLILSRVSSLVV